MAALVDVGWRVVMATVFTRSVLNPVGFALRCQTDKGLSPDADYLAIRRKEDAAAATKLGLEAADVHWLDLPEAPHRGYDDPKQLFAEILEGDELMASQVANRIAPLVVAADIIFAPLGIGGHVDHVQVIRAIDALAPRVPVVRWFDTPYILRLGEVPGGDLTCDVSATLDRKLDACAAYTSQLSFQFEGEGPMRERLSLAARRSAAGTGFIAVERFSCMLESTDSQAICRANLLPMPPLVQSVSIDSERS